MHVQLPFRSGQSVPAEHRSNFSHLYLDIAWYGVLSASALSFMTVYAARLGANALQLGLLNAGPATVNLFLTLPAGRWLEGRPIGRAVFWTAAANRLLYLLWVFLPLLLAPRGQVWALVASMLAMSVPGTALAVGFNALFAAVVPAEWRGYVAGIRNSLLAATFIAVSLLCGQILSRLPFPAGYQVVFAIGFLGAAMSTFHLWFVNPRRSSRPLALPVAANIEPANLSSAVVSRRVAGRRGLRSLRTDILRTSFGKLLVVTLAFYLAIQLAVPLFPLQWVNEIHLTDRQISLGQAAFYLSVFVGSTQFARLSRRFGNQRLAAIGAMFIASYPAFIGLAQGLLLFLVGSASGGIGSALFGGALVNYVLEKVPDDDRPAHLAWYNLALNAAILFGSLLGPLVAGAVGLRIALLVFALFRFLAAYALLRWE